MSLINRMLRDLSARERRAGDVLAGIEVPRPAGGRGGRNWARLGLLLVLVTFFTAVLWLVLPARKPASTVAAPASAPAAPVEPAASMVASPPAPAADNRLQLDTTLSQVPTTPAPRKPRRASGGTAAATAPAPAAAMAPAATTRGAKAAAQRYAEARAALARGDDKSAEDGFVEALALDPQLHAAREDLGTLRIRQGRLDEAERSVRRGLEESPHWIGYRRLAARLELARNNAAAAVALLERDAPTVASDPEYHGLLASAYQRLDRHEEAARAYQSLSQLQPTVAQWWAGYGLSRDALGDVTGALAAYAQARQFGGLDARVLEHINRRSAALAAGG